MDLFITRFNVFGDTDRSASCLLRSIWYSGKGTIRLRCSRSVGGFFSPNVLTLLRAYESSPTTAQARKLAPKRDPKPVTL